MTGKERMQWGYPQDLWIDVFHVEDFPENIREITERMLEPLNEELRTIVQAYYQEYCTKKETANRVGLTEAMVPNRLRHIHSILKFEYKKIEKEGNTEPSEKKMALESGKAAACKQCGRFLAEGTKAVSARGSIYCSEKCAKKYKALMVSSRKALLRNREDDPTGGKILFEEDLRSWENLQIIEVVIGKDTQKLTESVDA